jgi:hypothetical protein
MCNLNDVLDAAVICARRRQLVNIMVVIISAVTGGYMLSLAEQYFDNDSVRGLTRAV